MEITNVKVTLANNGRLRAYVSFVIEDAFIVRDVRLIEGEHRLFLAMPSKKTRDQFIEVAHPIKKEVREELENLVIDEYKRQLDIANRAAERFT